MYISDRQAGWKSMIADPETIRGVIKTNHKKGEIFQTSLIAVHIFPPLIFLPTNYHKII